MIRPEDARIEKMLEAFEDLGLSEEEMEKVEKYLRDEAGEEILQGFAFRDLEKLSLEAKSKCRAVCDSFYNRGRWDEMAKIFKVLFAIGQSTCGSPFTSSIAVLKSKEFREALGMHPAQIIAVYAQFMGGTRWFCRANTLDGFYELAGFRTENLRMALEYCKGDNATGRLLLYTLYFWKQYSTGLPTKKPVTQNVQQTAQEQKSGLFGTIFKLFGSKPVEEAAPAVKSADSPFDGQEALMMKQYEDILVRNIGVLFQNALPTELVTKLQEAARQGKMPAELLGKVKTVAINERLLEIVGGCAYINYVLSDVLKALVVLCAAADTKKTLEMCVNMDGRYDLKENSGNYDDIFGMEPVKLIAWAADNDNNSFGRGPLPSSDVSVQVLGTQFKKNRQVFLEYLKVASLDGNTRMMEVIKTLEPQLYKSMMGSGAGEQKEKVIQVIVSRLSAQKEAADYLSGKLSLQDLYPLADTLASGNRYGGNNEWKALNTYHKQYNDKEFFNRTLTLMALCDLPYFFRQPMYSRKDEAERFFKSFQEGGLAVANQLHTFVVVTDSFYSDTDKKEFLSMVQPIFMQYLKEQPEETKKAFAEVEAYGRYFGLCVMEQEADNYKTEILGFSQDTAKVVKEKLEEILQKQTGWRTEVTALLSSKKAAEREMAIRVLAHWNQPEDTEAMKKLLETEKNAKVRNLLESVLKLESGAEVGTKVLTVDELVKNLHKGGKKRSLAWAYETPFSQVHKKSGEVADEEYLQAILLCYTGMTNPGVSKDAKELAEGLNEAELAMYVNELFDKWLEAGAEAKKRWVMYAASIHGGSDIVKKLHHQIQEWPQNARGAIAADAVQALALNPQPQALLLVDGIARKFKFKQVKVAAGKALEFAAAQLGLTREELEDKIVPNLGFDENMERRFDYGERSFTVTITPALEIEVFDQDGKKLKNLPAPGKKDDEEKANAAYADFKEMKKQMKTTVSSQKARLEAALSAERLWSVEAWKNLFVKNPVMHQFAIGLIWGMYEEHKLVQSFRYMEDGSFNTEEEDEYTLPEQGYIGLVHPIELAQESKAAWKQQLEDYEITQPIEQLGREVFYRTEEEMQAKDLERFGGKVMNDLSLNGKMQQLGWYRGSVQDAGGFDTFYREDAGLGLGVELHFSGTYVGCMDEEVTVYEARFYKAGTIVRGSYVYDEAEGDKQVALKDIPERYFSEIVLQLTKATASSKEIEENWKKNRR